MSGFQNESTGSQYEPGTIMVLHGLSKTELNGELVELNQMVISDDGTMRWKCLQLKDTENPTQMISIKVSNLQSPPIPTTAQMKQSNDLVLEGRDLFFKTMKGASNKYIEKGKGKIAEALRLVPSNGMGYNVLGDIAHFEQKSPDIVKRYMRRAVANSLKTPEDNKRIFQARIGYAGSLGNMNDFEGEERQLRLNIASLERMHFPNSELILRQQLGQSLINQRRWDEALDVLLALKRVRPVLGTFQGINIDEQVADCCRRLSFKTYSIGDEIETAACSLSSSVSKEERMAQLQVAKQWYHIAIQAMPTDEATKQAWVRIQARLDPNMQETTLPDGRTAFQAMAKVQFESPATYL